LWGAGSIRQDFLGFGGTGRQDFKNPSREYNVTKSFALLMYLDAYSFCIARDACVSGRMRNNFMFQNNLTIIFLLIHTKLKIFYTCMSNRYVVMAPESIARKLPHISHSELHVLNQSHLSISPFF